MAHNEKRQQAGDTSQPLSQPAHSLPYDAVLRELSVDSEEGLTMAEAKKRLSQYGPNELEGGEGVSLVKIVIRQIANAMMLVSDLRCSPLQTKKSLSHWTNPLAILSRFLSLPWLSVLASNHGLREV
jgi:magnesium-transporting ATPase (P-type)